MQVIQYLDNGQIREYKIKEVDDPDDNITTVELTGEYEDFDIQATASKHKKKANNG